jgi:hypothetical protein
MTSVSIKIVNLDAHRRAKRRERLRAPFEGNGSARTLNEARDRIIALRLRRPRLSDFKTVGDYYLAKEAYIEHRLRSYDAIIFGDRWYEVPSDV